MSEEEIPIKLRKETIEVIRKTKDLLAKEEVFSWIRYLPIDGFLNFIFGLSEVSQYARETLTKLVAETGKTITATPTVITPEPAKIKGYYGEIQAKVIEALKGGNILLPLQIARKAGLRTKQVSCALENLKRKGIVKLIGRGIGWQLNEDELRYYKPFPPTIPSRILSLLEKEEPLSPDEIIAKLDLAHKRKTVHASISELVKRGLVRRTERGLIEIVKKQAK